MKDLEEDKEYDCFSDSNSNDRDSLYCEST